MHLKSNISPGGALMGALIGALALGGCAAQDLAKVGQIASGHVAKTLCSGVFVQGRRAETIRAEELGPETDERLKFFNAKIDAKERVVEASAFGAFRSRALYREGLGCALTPGEITPQMRAASGPKPQPVAHQFETAAPANPQGLDATLDLAFAPPAGAPNWRTRAVVVIHQGKLVAERYGDGYDANSPMWGASMAKTVSAMLVGILIDQGKIDPDADRLFPEWTDAPRRAITVQDLLSMQSGLAFSEDYAGASDATRMLYASSSASGAALTTQSQAPRGARFAYSSGDTNLLMRYARVKSGLSAEAWRAFPRQVLFDPLGLETAVFETDAEGDFIGSTYIYASARDWARLGLLMAQDGLWRGERILPAGWVTRMTTATPASKGAYGLQTWIDEGEIGAPAKLFSMTGFAGQYVYVRPATGTVIVRLGYHVGDKSFPIEAFVKNVELSLASSATPAP